MAARFSPQVQHGSEETPPQYALIGAAWECREIHNVSREVSLLPVMRKIEYTTWTQHAEATPRRGKKSLIHIHFLASSREAFNMLRRVRVTYRTWQSHSALWHAHSLALLVVVDCSLL